MKILLCNERFVFRFGLDRVLILLGQKFKAAGHQVTVMANRFDQNVVETFAHKIITAPVEFSAYPDLSEWTADHWLARRWSEIFGGDERFDIVLVGGWPFFGSIPILKQHTRRVIFLDYGAVPHTGYAETTQVILRKVTSLRQTYLPQASAIIAGSSFLADTQSRPDSAGRVPIYTILAGADHIDSAVWQSATGLSNANAEKFGLKTTQRLAAEGRKILLALGRWEPGCYKNSDAAFDILRRLKPQHPNIALLLLADQKAALIPDDLRNNVFPLGFPDDQELLAIMRQTDVGLSVSLWEGHNLPLSEMQWLNRPALAFNLAAHPEVVINPWYLCQDNAEMAAKTSALLFGHGPTKEDCAQWSTAHQARFTWDRTAAEYLATFQKVLDQPVDIITQETKMVRIIIDVTNASRDTANSGVIRVTRRFGRELQNHIDPIFTVWDPESQQYVSLNEHEADVLSRYNGPLADTTKFTAPSERRQPLDNFLDKDPDQPTWLFQCEVMSDINGRRSWAATRGFHTAAIFYDAIPVLRPDLVSDIVRQGHSQYMQALADIDLVVAISAASRDDLRRFWSEHQLAGHHLVANLLPGEFGGSSRQTSPHPSLASPIRMLCVSTIEPRKNHLTLLAALDLLSKQHPDLDWQLTLVGNRYAGAEDLYDQVESIARENPRIQLAGVINDDALQHLYKESTFTIYPSLIEGFGMPIVESLWNATPCICSNQSVMAELAASGGCLPSNVSKPEALATAIHQLATDNILYERLSNEATIRRMKTWDDYAHEWVNLLFTCTPDFSHPLTDLLADDDFSESPLRRSEHLALAAVLLKLNPKCIIAIGREMISLLPLLQNYSQILFLITPTPPSNDTEKLLQKNVSILIGHPAHLLPLLIRELKTKNIGIDVIFLDALAINNNLHEQINSLITAPPLSPTFLLIHNSAYPASHQALQKCAWNSPYIQWVDLNFIPATSSGGLAAAYLLPTLQPASTITLS